MNAGLPTTGIGGIFYIVSVVVMLTVEFILIFQGKSSVARWRFVLGQVFLITGIISFSLLTGFALLKVAPANLTHQLTAITTQQGQNSFSFITLTPLLILITLLTSTQLLRGYYAIKSKLSSRK